VGLRPSQWMRRRRHLIRKLTIYPDALFTLQLDLSSSRVRHLEPWMSHTSFCKKSQCRELVFVKSDTRCIVCRPSRPRCRGTCCGNAVCSATIQLAYLSFQFQEGARYRKLDDASDRPKLWRRQQDRPWTRSFRVSRENKHPGCHLPLEQNADH
jgi:hypothetical protein